MTVYRNHALTSKRHDNLHRALRLITRLGCDEWKKVGHTRDDKPQRAAFDNDTISAFQYQFRAVVNNN